jgi:hypothetical protein
MHILQTKARVGFLMGQMSVEFLCKPWIYCSALERCKTMHLLQPCRDAHYSVGAEKSRSYYFLPFLCNQWT